MGISRRKSGTVVRCPTCAGQVVVPNPDASASGSGRGGPNLFERSDFDDVLRPESPAATVSAGGEQAGHPPPGAWGTNADPMIDMERVDAVAVAAPVTPSAQGTAPPAGVV